MEGNPEFGCDLHPIDFAACARAFGINGHRVTRHDELRPALSAAFSMPGPAVVDAVVDQNEPVVPGHISMRQAMNFAKSMLRGEKDRAAIIKTMVADRIREVI